MNVMRRLIGLGMICLSPFVLAEQTAKELLYIQSLAATCANCHGTAGAGVAGGSVPRLAGLNREYFVEQMSAFKSGARQATIMHQLAKGFTADQIDALAVYFSKQPR
jgi:sulfide dehydrogenase cytochrome subunit